MIANKSHLNIVRIGTSLTYSSLKQIGDRLVESFHGIIKDVGLFHHDSPLVDSIDAFVSDWSILASLRSCAQNLEELDILSKEVRLGGGPYGIGVPENDSRWRDAINSVLQDIWKDGTWDAIFSKWFGPSTPFNLKKEDLSFQMPFWQ